MTKKAMASPSMTGDGMVEGKGPGSRANPAQVDIEGIAAKLEDGVLRVTVPKMNGEFVEVRKVDVE